MIAARRCKREKRRAFRVHTPAERLYIYNNNNNMASSPKLLRLVLTLSPPPPGAAPRVEASFAPSSTLGDVIVALARDGQLGTATRGEELLASGFEGVTVVYVRSAIRGAELEKVTLASLGLGKAGSAGAGLRLSLQPAGAATAAAAPAPACGDRARVSPPCVPCTAAAPSLCACPP